MCVHVGMDEGMTRPGTCTPLAYPYRQQNWKDECQEAMGEGGHPMGGIEAVIAHHVKPYSQ